LRSIITYNWKLCIPLICKNSNQQKLAILAFQCEFLPHQWPLVSQPYFGQVWGWSPTLGKSEDLESSRTPECLEFNRKAQNTSNWGVLGVIGKVLKCKYWKWPRIGHLDIWSPSYGQKKGRESNWQFDSRPLKVGNRPLPDLRIESAIRRWKDLDEGYKFGLDLVAIRLCSRELWAPKVPGLHPGQFRDDFGTPTWESREKEPFGCSLNGVAQRILYGGRWWLPPSPGRGVSCGPKCPWPNTQGCPGMWSNHVGGLFWCKFKLDLLNLLPSLIPGLPTQPSTPF
jgi:hypothetical protein